MILTACLTAALSAAEVCPFVSENGAIRIDGSLEIGPVFRNDKKSSPFASCSGVEKQKDGSLKLNYRVPGKKETLSAVLVKTDRGGKFIFTLNADKAPGNLMLSVLPVNECVKEAVSRRAYGQIFSTPVPTMRDGRDVTVRPYRTKDGSVLLTLPTGNEAWGNKVNGEHLNFVRIGTSLFRAELEFAKEIPYRNPDEKLAYASAYSLEIDGNGCGTDGFFPLGVLGDGFEKGFTCYIGGNYAVKGFSPESKFNPNRQGVYGISIWGAIRAQGVRKLARAYHDDGKPQRQVCLFDPAVRQWIFDYAKAAVKRAVEQNNQAIFKWEIDNEYLPMLDYSPLAVAEFRKWLPERYEKNLEKFNRAWKTDYSSFQEAVPPKLSEYAEKPAAFMDWSRFQQETFAAFLGEYYKTIHEADPMRRGVNGKDTQSSLEMQRIARTRRSNHELIGKAVAPYANGVRGMDHYGHGDRNAYEINYYYNTIAPAEVKPGKRVGMLYGENNNHNGPGWQFAQTVWRMIPNGLRGGHFFCNGWFGAWGDWASFGFTNPDGTRRDKFYYLPRFYAMIHRTEKFLTQSVPATGVPRLGILFAQRDVPFGVDDNITPWGFPINSRLRLYSHLRNAGYWVQVLTYEKLKPEYMKNIDGLFLVGAEHLSSEDLRNIREYVKNGGKLFADTRAGMYDEHHLPHETGLSDVLGIQLKGLWTSSDVVVDPGDVWFGSKYGNLVRADGRVKFKLDSAKVVNAYHAFCTSNKAAVLTRNQFGKGTAYWINTQFGTIRSESAEGEDPARDFFRELLADADIPASYALIPDRTGNFRAEIPMVDGKGNTMIAVSSLTYQPLAKDSIFSVRLPKDTPPFEHAFLGLAEENHLRRLSFKRTKEGAEFHLPELKSAGMIYLLTDHAPLLGLRFPDLKKSAKADPFTAEFRPGDRFEVAVQLVNPGMKKLNGGTLTLNALSGWKVSAPRKTKALNPGGMDEFLFTVEIPKESKSFIPNFIYPLTADFELGGKRTAVTHSVVSLELPLENRELLLSDNWSTENEPWAVWTGADYRYLTIPDKEKKQSINDSLHTTLGDGTEVRALLSGDRYDRRKMAVYKNLPEVEVLFDLKKNFRLTRALVRRGRSSLSEAPVRIAASVSEDGKTFGPEVSALTEWTGPYCNVRFPETTGRFLRLKFFFPGNTGNLDEVWIFGKKE